MTPNDAEDFELFQLFDDERIRSPTVSSLLSEPRSGEAGGAFDFEDFPRFAFSFAHSGSPHLF
jgi:hypothetical protein